MTEPQDRLSTGSITQLLNRLNNGEETARDELFERVYEQLKQIARKQLRAPKDRDLLQTTAVVNEACLRMADNGFKVSPKNRGDLFAAVSRAVQWVLVDYARKRKAQKRTPDKQQLIDDAIKQYERDSGAEYLDLHEALASLREQHPRIADVVEARFFGGMTVAGAAHLFGLSADTAKRDWRFGRAFLHARLMR